MERAKYPKKKDVMVIVDVPVQDEIKRGDKYSSSSNLGLLTSLRTGKLTNYSKESVKYEYGINSLSIFPTYLDYTYFGDGEVEHNYDYSSEIKKKKDIKEDETFIKLEHQKDVYVSERLYNQFLALLEEIRLVEPKLIILTGKWSLFFLTGCTSLTQNMGTAKDRKPFGGLAKFRSSVMVPHEIFSLPELVIVPIYHPINAISMPDKKYVMEMDLEKVGWMNSKIKSEGVGYYIRPDKQYTVDLDKELILDNLDSLLARLDKKPTLVSIDVETMFLSIIDCIGITDSTEKGICIAFASASNPNLWSLEDEIDIMLKIREVMEHKNCQHVGQNYAYDCQYFHKLWCLPITTTYDTMVIHHVLYNYMAKDLAFLASIYCETYTYWKDDVNALKESPETRWIYNVKDVCYTLEICEVLVDILSKQKKSLQNFYSFQQNEVAPVLVAMMNRGVKVDLDKKQLLLNELTDLLVKVEKDIQADLGMEINLKSPIQVKKLFVDFLNIKPVISKKSKSATFGSEAMLVYLEEYPIYEPLITAILEYRSIGVFVRTFLSMKVDDDNRMRTSYNIAGTKSYRLSSRKNAFGNGGNLANIPSKGKIDLKYALMADTDEDSIEESLDGVIADREGINKLPNCKTLFLPDEDYNFFNIDYSGADAMVVAWDSDCAWLQNFFTTSKEKLYIYVAREYLQRDVTTHDPFYKKIKQFIHLTNYGGMEEKAAISSGLTRVQARELRNWYFKLCPEIENWHKRIANEVRTRGYIENIFGARFWLLDKNSPTLLNQAYALIPQSTIGLLVNKGMVNIHVNEPNVHALLQIHDAVAGQYLRTDITAPERIKKHMEIVIPYTKPLIIPADISISEESYGGCD